MKKIFKAILSFTAALFVFASCQDEDVNLGSRVSLSQTEEIQIPAQGAESFSFSVESDGDWVVVVPEWIKATPRYGTGDSAVTLKFVDNTSVVTDAEGNVTVELNGVRHGTVSVECASGATSFVVRQDGDPSKPSDEIQTVTVSEFNAKPDGAQVYEVSGVVTSIVNTTYGNLYIKDDTGELYVYGVLDRAGNPKNFLSLGISVGDKVTLQGPKSTYKGTIEMVNATVVAHEKSNLSLDKASVSVAAAGEEFTVGVTYTGDLKVVSDSPWLAFTGISSTSDGTVLNFAAAANTGDARSATVVVTSTADGVVASQELKVNQAAGSSGGEGGEGGGDQTDVITISVADFLAAPESSTQKYKLTGTIGGTINTTYGNFDLTDESGTVYVYGLTATELGYGAKNDKSYASLGLAEGDKITLIGYRGSYGDKIEVTYAYFVSKQ